MSQWGNRGMAAQRKSLIVLLILLVVILPALVQIAWPFSTSFLLASMLAIVTHPAKEWLSLRLHRPALATWLTTLGATAVLGTFLAFGGYTIAREATSAYDELGQRSLEEGGWPALVAGTVDRAADALASRLPVSKETIRIQLMDRMKSVGGYLIRAIGGALGGVTTMIFTALVVTIFLYFLLRYGRDWIGRLALLTPLDPPIAWRIFATIHDSVVANVNGVFAVVLGQGLLLVLGFWIAGVRSAVLWGTVGGFASIIPVIGAPLVWVPVVIAFLVQGLYVKALLLGLWCSVVVGSVDNVLRPLVVGARDKQNPVLVALAAVGGTYAFGAIGILLGPLLVSLAFALVSEIQQLAPNDALASDVPGSEAKAPDPTLAVS